ncbi:MAG: hypothetical protein MRY63_02080 [Neomegalonema sp.]|nr:hypothetical protein [Neomegalonema sp.]
MMLSRFLIPLICLLAGSALAQPTGRLLFVEEAPGSAALRLRFLPEENGVIDDLPPGAFERLLVTGTYSSGDDFRPEGFVIRQGDPTRPYPQGWDGLLLAYADGRADIFELGAVRLGDEVFDLRDKAAKWRFVELARLAGVSAVQSHLLIREGVLDLRPVENARRFHRRILFQLEDGRLGIWDSRPQTLTLYEAAQALQKILPVRMALNLDMGAYDFCERATAQAAENCGLLDRSRIGPLTNVIEVSAPKLLPETVSQAAEMEPAR